MNAAEDEEKIRFSPTSTDGERAVFAAITRSQHALLSQYERAIGLRSVLDQEQAQWRHQSPSERGVNTSPKNSWSTSRRLGKLSSKKHTRNPPAFTSDDVHHCSLKNARRTSEKLARIIDAASRKEAERQGAGVVKKLRFSSVERA